jgi:hypothetical protein
VKAGSLKSAPSHENLHLRQSMRRLEVFLQVLAHEAVHAVRAEDQVSVAIFFQRLHFRVEHQLDAQLLAAFLKDVQQLLARHAREAVPGAADALAVDVRVNVRPVGELGGDAIISLLVGLFEAAKGFVAEDNSPAERVVRAIAFDDRDVVAGVLLLHQDREVKPRRPAADARDLHGAQFSESP